MDEKQTPKDVLSHEPYGGYPTWAVCPVCDNLLFVYAKWVTFNYCNFCGQKLKYPREPLNWPPKAVNKE